MPVLSFSRVSIVCISRLVVAPAQLHCVDLCEYHSYSSLWPYAFLIMCLQIMALIVIGLGVPVTLLFQIFIHEDPDARPPKMKWYKWIMNPQFYLVGQNGYGHTIVFLPVYKCKG